MARATDFADLTALLCVERRRGAFLPDFLVASLQRAVAFAKMDRVSLTVAEHLELDMTGLLEIFFQIDDIVAERGLGLDLRRANGVRPVRRRDARLSCRVRRRQLAALTMTG